MAVCHSKHGTAIAAVGYLRKSTDKQEASLPEQRKAVERYADQHGYKIVRWYTDSGISGDATEKRLDFQAMHKAACNGRDFDVILCWDLDRFGRFDSLEAGYWVHPLVKAGVRLVTVGDGLIDWSDFTGRVMYGIKQEGKHQFLRDLSRNVSRGLLGKAQRGEWPAAAPPMGYVVTNAKVPREQRRDKPQRLVLGDAEQVALVRRIFQMYLDGGSIRSIVCTLNTEGKTTAAGRAWTVSALRYILTNEFLTGDFIWNTRCRSKYNGIRGGDVSADFQPGNTESSDWIVIRGNHPAIIDRVTFDAVQRRLVERKNGVSTPQKSGGEFVLTGLLRCAKCGSKMHGTTVSGKQFFLCGGYLHKSKSFCDRNGVKQEEVLERVISTIEAEYLNPAVVKRLRDELHRQVKQAASKASAEQLRHQIGTVDQQLGKAKRRLVEVDHDMLAVVQDQIRELQVKRGELDAALQAASTPLKRLLADADSKVDSAMRAFGRLREALLKVDTVRLREFIRHAVEKVVLAVDHHVVGRRKQFTLSGGEIHLQSNNLFGIPGFPTPCL